MDTRQTPAEFLSTPVVNWHSLRHFYQKMKQARTDTTMKRMKRMIPVWKL